jgi:RND family efflux transporter MFP subunit
MMHTTRQRNTNSRKPHGKMNLVVILIIVAAVFAGLFLIGFLPRMENKKDLKKTHEVTVGSVPIVQTVIAKRAPLKEEGNLPGNISAIQYVTINARVDGYLKSRLVDIGDWVKRGQLLAEIDTPTIDQELNQAKADLAESESQLESAKAKLKEAIAQDVAAKANILKSQANEEFAHITSDRWIAMATKGAVSLQSRDEKVRQYKDAVAQLQVSIAQEKASQAAVNSAEAEVGVSKSLVAARTASVARIAAQQNFKRVVAPFDGVITLRKVDPGSLISSGSQMPTLELFQLAKIDTLRIYVNVPQTFARFLLSGQKAEVFVPEMPDKIFEGTVTNIAGALDPSTRTRQTEVRIDNKNHELLPGMYAQVRVTVKREEEWITVPGTALVPKGDGTYVAVVKDDCVHFNKIEIGRDFGDSVEVKRGLAGGETVIVSPPIDLIDGEKVKPSPLAD